VLVEGSTLDAGPELVAERLLEVLRQPYDMRKHIGRELTLTASIGLAFGLRGDAGELLRDADVALYQAKAAGRNRHVLFRADMQSAVQDRLTTQMELLEALANDKLFLLYKPTFDLQSGRVAGIEALVRWHHPTRGVLAAREFLPIAESSGLIVALGGWVLAQACRQTASWHARGLPANVSVNVSARQLATEELVGQAAQALHDSGLDPAALTLEINESALLADPHATGARLRALGELGVQITIDDFASGYSALASPQALPVTALKLDRVFVERLARSPRKTALLETFVALGRTLAIDTLAEGIEDGVALASAQHERCEQEHGFLFSRPLDADDAEAFLRANQSAGQPQPTR
jgi:predicted signal transduction protein with EAL and GGDEF domain